MKKPLLTSLILLAGFASADAQTITKNTAINDGTDASKKAIVTSGSALKVDGSATTQPVSISGTSPVIISGTPTVTVGGTVATTSSGTQTVSVAGIFGQGTSSNSLPVTISTDNYATTSGTLMQIASNTTSPELNVDGYATLTMSFVPTAGFTGQGTFQCSADGTNWINFNTSQVFQSASGGGPSSSFNAGLTTLVSFNVIGVKKFRITTVNYSGSGTSTATYRLSQLSAPYFPATNNGLILGNVGNVTDGRTVITTLTGENIGVVPSAQVGTNLYNPVRTTAVFKTGTFTASGTGAVWTPTSGKKFRLMAYQIMVTPDIASATAGDLDIVLQDGTNALAASASFYVPTVSATTNAGVFTTPWVTFGNGILSSSTSNALNVNLSGSISAGRVRVVVAGTEE